MVQGKVWVGRLFSAGCLSAQPCDVVSHLWEGFSLSQSLKRHPKVFSPMVTALIGSAEESGNLPKIAEQIAAFLAAQKSGNNVGF